MNKLFGFFTCLCLCGLWACVNKSEGYVIRGTAEGTEDGDSLQKGWNSIKLSNPDSKMPSFDCMTLKKIK